MKNVSNEAFVRRFVSPLAEPEFVGKVLLVSLTLTLAVSLFDYNWHIHRNRGDSTLSTRPVQAQLSSKPVRERQREVTVKQLQPKVTAESTALVLAASQK